MCSKFSSNNRLLSANEITYWERQNLYQRSRLLCETTETYICIMNLCISKETKERCFLLGAGMGKEDEGLLSTKCLYCFQWCNAQQDKQEGKVGVIMWHNYKNARNDVNGMLYSFLLCRSASDDVGRLNSAAKVLGAVPKARLAFGIENCSLLNGCIEP